VVREFVPDWIAALPDVALTDPLASGPAEVDSWADPVPDISTVLPVTVNASLLAAVMDPTIKPASPVEPAVTVMLPVETALSPV
jgi:hypothetical protein